MRALLFFLIPVAAAAGDEGAPAGARLRAQADPAVIELEPVAENLRYLQLPDLAFDLRIEPYCDSGATVRSVLVSVADTRLHGTGTESDEPLVLQPTLTVPGRQAGVLRVDGFCRAGSPVETTRLRVYEVLTARLSLRCASKDGESVAYVTLPLDLLLECRGEQTPAEDPAAPRVSSP